MYLLKLNLKSYRHLAQAFFIDQSYFNSDGSQNYKIFEPLYYALKRVGDTEKVVSWKSKDLSAEKLTTPTTTDNSLYRSIKWYGSSKFCLILKGSCLKQKTQIMLPLIE